MDYDLNDIIRVWYPSMPLSSIEDVRDFYTPYEVSIRGKVSAFMGDGLAFHDACIEAFSRFPQLDLYIYSSDVPTREKHLSLNYFDGSIKGRSSKE